MKEEQNLNDGEEVFFLEVVFGGAKATTYKFISSNHWVQV